MSTGAGIVLIIVCLLLYALTLDNGFRPQELEGGDLITHQYAQVEARPSNAPGYPLYTMGGWLWFHGIRMGLRILGNPLPNPIPILSSYSTLWALLALWLFYRILCRTTRDAQAPAGNWPLAWALSLFYAVTYFFWFYATTTEQYSSAVAQTLAIVWVYLVWREKWGAGRDGICPTPPLRHAATPPLFTLFLLAFLCGISLAHMLTVAFIVPPLVAVVLWDAPWLLRSLKAVVGALVAALLPLLSYLYVYVRGARHPEWWGAGEWTTTQEWFWTFLSTAQGREELRWGFEPWCGVWDGGFPALMGQELSWPLIVIGLVGIAWLDGRLRLLLYGTLVIYLGFSWMYRCGNWFQVILPAYPLVLMGVAVVGDKIVNSQWAMGNGQWVWTRRQQVLLLGILGVAIVWRVGASLPQADSRNRAEDVALDRAALLLDQPLPAGIALFAAVDDALALQYLSAIWGIRPDVTVVSSPQAAQWLARGESVFATHEAAVTLRAELPAALPITIQSGRVDWVEFSAVKSSQSRSVGDMRPVVEGDILAEEGIALHGYRFEPGPTGAPVHEADAPLDLTLFWEIKDANWPDGLSISIRPTQHGAFIPDATDPAGGIIQRDSAAPVQGLVGLGEIGIDRLLADAYRLPWPPRADGIIVILYRATDAGFENVAEIRLGVK